MLRSESLQVRSGYWKFQSSPGDSNVQPLSEVIGLFLRPLSFYFRYFLVPIILALFQFNSEILSLHCSRIPLVIYSLRSKLILLFHGHYNRKQDSVFLLLKTQSPLRSSSLPVHPIHKCVLSTCCMPEIPFQILGKHTVVSRSDKEPVFHGSYILESHPD